MSGVKEWLGLIAILFVILMIIFGVIIWFACGLFPLCLLAYGAVIGAPVPVNWLYTTGMSLIIMFVAVPVWEFIWFVIMALISAV